MSGRRLIPACAALAVAVSAAGCSGRADRPAGDEPGLSLAAALGDQPGDADFEYVSTPPSFAFPADHGPHPAYRQEWWYFTGHLEGEGGRRFGYQVTFFRFALDRTTPSPAQSAWHASQVYMAHLAVSDIDGGRFHAEERLARAALGLAGAETEPLEVWVEDWRLSARPATPGAPIGPEASTAAGPAAAGPAAAFAIDLTLAGEEVSLALRVTAARPITFQGVDGYSRKGEEPTNASAYYSITRLDTEGTLRLPDGEALRVSGSSWFDREWGTSFLAPGVAGWDWFSLQLADGRDLMYYRLRREDGGSTAHSAGTLVTPVDGGTRVERLRADEVVLEPLEWWTSPDSGVRYPVRWSVRLPARDLSLTVDRAIPNQELRLAARYWEGAVDVSGEQAGRPVSGRGYLELAGY